MISAEPISLCPTCNGQGVRPCPRCHGEGAIAGELQARACPSCRDRLTGLPSRLATCAACEGTGLLAATPAEIAAAELADTVRPPASERVASCGCGRHYTPETWHELVFVGLQDDGMGGWLELRNCTCRSTIATQLPRVAARVA